MLRLSKKKNKKISRWIASILAVVMFVTSNGSFLVWGLSEGQLNFLGEPAVARASIVETAKAITIDEILEGEVINKKHWWEFWKNNVKYDSQLSDENVFSDVKTEIVAREILEDKAVNTLNENANIKLRNIEKERGWIESDAGTKEKGWVATNWDKFTSWVSGNKDKQITEQEAEDFGLDNGLGEKIAGIGDEGVKNIINNQEQEKELRRRGYNPDDPESDESLKAIAEYSAELSDNLPDNNNLYESGDVEFIDLKTGQIKGLLAKKYQDYQKYKKESNAANSKWYNPLTWNIFNTGKDHTPMTVEEYAKESVANSDFRMYPEFEGGKSKKQSDKNANKPNAYDPNSGKPLVIAIIDTGNNSPVNEEFISDKINVVKDDIVTGYELGDSDIELTEDHDVASGNSFHGGLVTNAFFENEDIKKMIRDEKVEVVIIKAGDGSWSKTDALARGFKKAQEIGANIINYSTGGYTGDKNAEYTSKQNFIKNGGTVVQANGNERSAIYGDRMNTEFIEENYDKAIFVLAANENGPLITANGSKSVLGDVYAIAESSSEAAPKVTAKIAVDLVNRKITDINQDDVIDGRDVDYYISQKLIVDSVITSANAASYITAVKFGEYDKARNLFIGENLEVRSPEEFGIVEKNPFKLAQIIDNTKVILEQSSQEEMHFDQYSKIAQERSVGARLGELNKSQKQAFNLSDEFIRNYNFTVRRLARFDGDYEGELFIERGINNGNQKIRISADELSNMTSEEYNELIDVLNTELRTDNIGSGENGFWTSLGEIFQKEKKNNQKNDRVSILENELPLGSIVDSEDDGGYTKLIKDLKTNELTKLDPEIFAQKESEYYREKIQNDPSNTIQAAVKLRNTEEKRGWIESDAGTKEKGWVATNWNKFTSWLSGNKDNQAIDEETVSFDGGIAEDIAGLKMSNEILDKKEQAQVADKKNVIAEVKGKGWLAKVGSAINPLNWFDTKKDHTPLTAAQYAKQIDDSEDFRMYPEFEKTEVEIVKKNSSSRDYISTNGDVAEKKYEIFTKEDAYELAEQERDDMISRIKDPRYLERLIRMYNGDIEAATEEQLARVERVHNFPVKIVDLDNQYIQNMRTNGMNPAGLVHWEEETDILSLLINWDRVAETGKNQDSDGHATRAIKPILRHENGHMVDDGGYALPDKSRELFNNSVKTKEEWEKQDLSSTERRIGYNYYNRRPGELSTRLMIGRDDLAKLTGKDRNSDFTLDDIDELYDEFKNNPDNLDVNTKELLHSVKSKEALKELLYNIADTKEYSFGNSNEFYADNSQKYFNPITGEEIDNPQVIVAQQELAKIEVEQNKGLVDKFFGLFSPKNSVADTTDNGQIQETTDGELGKKVYYQGGAKLMTADEYAQYKKEEMVNDPSNTIQAAVKLRNIEKERGWIESDASTKEKGWWGSNWNKFTSWVSGNKDKQITEQEAEDFGLDNGLGEMITGIGDGGNINKSLTQVNQSTGNIKGALVASVDNSTGWENPDTGRRDTSSLRLSNVVTKAIVQGDSLVFLNAEGVSIGQVALTEQGMDELNPDSSQAKHTIDGAIGFGSFWTYGLSGVLNNMLKLVTGKSVGDNVSEEMFGPAKEFLTSGDVDRLRFNLSSEEKEKVVQALSQKEELLPGVKNVLEDAQRSSAIWRNPDNSREFFGVELSNDEIKQQMGWGGKDYITFTNSDGTEVVRKKVEGKSDKEGEFVGSIRTNGQVVVADDMGNKLEETLKALTLQRGASLLGSLLGIPLPLELIPKRFKDPTMKLVTDVMSDPENFAEALDKFTKETGVEAEKLGAELSGLAERTKNGKLTSEDKENIAKTIYSVVAETMVSRDFKEGFEGAVGGSGGVVGGVMKLWDKITGEEEKWDGKTLGSGNNRPWTNPDDNTKLPVKLEPSANVTWVNPDGDTTDENGSQITHITADKQKKKFPVNEDEQRVGVVQKPVSFWNKIINGAKNLFGGGDKKLTDKVNNKPWTNPDTGKVFVPGNNGQKVGTQPINITTEGREKKKFPVNKSEQSVGVVQKPVSFWNKIMNGAKNFFGGGDKEVVREKWDGKKLTDKVNNKPWTNPDTGKVFVPGNNGQKVGTQPGNSTVDENRGNNEDDKDILSDDTKSDPAWDEQRRIAQENNSVDIWGNPIPGIFDTNTQGANAPPEINQQGLLDATFNTQQFLEKTILPGMVSGGRRAILAMASGADREQMMKIIAEDIIKSTSLGAATELFGSTNKDGKKKLGWLGQGLANAAAGIATSLAVSGDPDNISDELIDIASNFAFQAGVHALGEGIGLFNADNTNETTPADVNESNLLGTTDFGSLTDAMTGYLGNGIRNIVEDLMDGKDLDESLKHGLSTVALGYLDKVVIPQLADLWGGSGNLNTDAVAGGISAGFASAARQWLSTGDVDMAELGKDIAQQVISSYIIDYIGDMANKAAQAAMEALADEMGEVITEDVLATAGAEAAGDAIGNYSWMVKAGLTLVRLFADGEITTDEIVSTVASTATSLLVTAAVEAAIVAATTTAVGSAGAGAAAGANSGSSVGPWGAAIGAIVGALIGLLMYDPPTDSEIEDWKTIAQEAIMPTLAVEGISGQSVRQITSVAMSGNTSEAKRMMRTALNNTALGKIVNMAGLGGLFESALAMMNNRIERLNGSYINKRGGLSTEDYIDTGDVELDKLTNAYIKKKNGLKYCYETDNTDCIADLVQDLRRIRNGLLAAATSKFNDKIAALNGTIHGLQVLISQAQSEKERIILQAQLEAAMAQRNNIRGARDQYLAIARACPPGKVWQPRHRSCISISKIKSYCEDRGGSWKGVHKGCQCTAKAGGQWRTNHCVYGLNKDQQNQNNLSDLEKVCRWKGKHWNWNGSDCVEVSNAEIARQECDKRHGTWHGTWCEYNHH